MTQWQPQQIDRLQLIGTMLQFHRNDRPLNRLAVRLQIDPAVLLALEGGRTELLPTPKQTRLIIQHYSQVLGVEYLNLAESLPLISAEEDSPKKLPKTNSIALPRMPRRSRRSKWLFSRRLWRRFSARSFWGRFPVRRLTLSKITSFLNFSDLRERSQALQLWLGITLFLGACLGVIVAIVHLIFILFLPEGRLFLQRNPWGIVGLGIFEFLKVFLSFTCFFGLLLWWGAVKRSPSQSKVPPSDSREKNETPHDR
jgi:hypothetical protein